MLSFCYRLLQNTLFRVTHVLTVRGGLLHTRTHYSLVYPLDSSLIKSVPGLLILLLKLKYTWPVSLLRQTSYLYSSLTRSLLILSGYWRHYVHVQYLGPDLLPSHPSSFTSLVRHKTSTSTHLIHLTTKSQRRTSLILIFGIKTDFMK